MRTPGVKWILSLGDEEAARTAVGTILAVAADGAPVTVALVRDGGRAAPSRTETRLRHLIDRPIGYDTTVLRLDPAAWPELRAREAGRYVIGAASWDADTLPAEWVASANALDEVWVPSARDVEVFTRSGVERPVITMPVCAPETEAGAGDSEPIDGLGSGTWVFYSILDWSERSNPKDLVEAYLSAFSGVRDVVLALASTGPEDPSGELLRQRIGELKRNIQLSHYAKIVALAAGPDRSRIRALHARGDCFAQLGRGGGWDSEAFEAACRGKPVLAPCFGAAGEYLSEECAYPVPVTLRPVENMPSSPLHRATQLWAQPDVERAARLMRRVYEDRQEAKRKGALAAARLAARHAPESVAKRLLGRLAEIRATG